MMSNLFSIFDPSSSWMNTSWMVLMAPMMMVNTSMKTTKMKNKNLMKLVKMNIKKETLSLMQKSSKKSSSSTMESMFMFIMMLNMMSLMPMNFTPTAHMTITLTLSTTMWLSIMMLGWTKSYKKMMTHLTPTGTPSALMNFMVLIEIISNLIRPVTLSVRMTANMVAGHLLVTLLSNFSLNSMTNTTSSGLVMMALSLLEMMVGVIQAYVITMLMTLYYMESN